MKRQNELEAHKSGKLQKDREMSLLEQEVRQKVIDEYKQQADQYVTDQIAMKQLELQQAFENEVMQEASKRSMNQSQQSFEFEMEGEPRNDEKMQNGIAGNLERS